MEQLGRRIDLDISAAGRHYGLLGATGVGVGAIVGGGILALAGVAFSTAGPAAMVAFALNGLIALLTALSFAEMSSKFPESGGTYTYAKKVLSVEAAFSVGWVVWFASIVAAVLYAVGFAYFALLILADIWRCVAGYPADVLANPYASTVVATITTALLAIGLARRASGGGQAANVGKVVVFAVLILGGFWAVFRSSTGEITGNLQPFFSGGVIGLIQAMGYTFIALQGFDLIAAVGGEIREPTRVIPRAMMCSLGIALAIYLPLLFVISSVGVPSNQSVVEFASKNPEDVVAVAAQRFLGPLGYWLVIVAAVLSMFSALQANLLAASRIALAMARDRTIPSPLGLVSEKRGTPIAAVVVTTVIIVCLLLILDDVSSAGAAASLIFLLSFALVHWLAILVRQRSAQRPPPFRVPWFPALPVVGGFACLALAIFQGLAVPAAGRIVVVWLSGGGFLFLVMFARRARIRDASSIARDPELITLRGRSPLILVPIANPQNVEAMLALANALVPGDVGRVVSLVVAVAGTDRRRDSRLAVIDQIQETVGQSLRAAHRLGIRSETLITTAPEPMAEIARVARLHRCEAVLLGLSEISQETSGSPLEWLLSTVDADTVVLRSKRDWQINDTKEILIPLGGRGGHDRLRARLLGSMTRTGERNVTFLRVLSENATQQEISRARRELSRFAEDEVDQPTTVEVVTSPDPVAVVAERSDECDLIVLGVQRLHRRNKLYGGFVREVAQRTSSPIVVISRRG
jgi:amino acid transporter/nucleotide-binding universal stress UspA family protein